MMTRISTGCSVFTAHWLKKSESERDSLPSKRRGRDGYTSSR